MNIYYMQQLLKSKVFIMENTGINKLIWNYLIDLDSTKWNMSINRQKVFGVAIAATKILNLAQLLGRKNQKC